MGVGRGFFARLFGSRQPTAPGPRLELVTRANCHLCDEMAALLDAELPALGSDWKAVDIDDRPDLLERFDEVVPVLLRDGRAVAKVRTDRQQLARIVRKRR